MNLIPRNQIFDFDSLFNDFFPGFGRSRLSASNGGSMAGMRGDVHENDKEFEIHPPARTPSRKRRTRARWSGVNAAAVPYPAVSV